MTIIKRDTQATMTNLETLISKTKVSDKDSLQLSVIEFLEIREVNHHYELNELNTIIYKNYLRIKQNEKRKNQRIDTKKEYIESIDLIADKKYESLLNDDCLKLIKSILSKKQWLSFDNWLDNGLPKDKKSKEYAREQRSIFRILKILSGYKSLHAKLMQDKNLDSFTDSYDSKAIFKGGRQKSDYYSKKAGKLTHYEYVKTDDEELNAEQQIELKKLIPVKKIKRPDICDSLSYEYCQKKNVPMILIDEKWNHSPISGFNFNDFKKTCGFNLDPNYAEIPQVICKQEKLVARFGFYPDQLLTLNKKNAKKVNGVAVYRDGRPIEKFLTYYHEKELGNNTLINEYMIKVGLKTDWKLFNKCN